MERKKPSARRRAYQILEKAQPGDTASHVVDLFILTLIALNIVALMLETIPALNASLHGFFHMFNMVSVIIFTVEYFLRIWAAAEAEGTGSRTSKTVRYIFSLMALIDLAAILPFYLAILPIDMRFLRALRLMRVFRIFKIGRYSNSIGTMARVFRRKKADLLVSLFVVTILLTFFANLMYHIENVAQPGVFSNAFQAMWWGIITITGVGYGDAVPITVAGKIMGGCIAILGILTVAIPIGILGSAYVEDAASKRLGRIKVIRSSDHIIICGFNGITALVIEDLLAEVEISRVVLVTQKPNPEIPGVLYVHADWTDIQVLRRLSIENARSCVIMAETPPQAARGSADGSERNSEMVDMRTLFTLYKVKQEFPDLHTVVEVTDPGRVPMVKTNLLADEVILKETIDGNLVANCVKIPGVSRLIYELINLEGKVLNETSLRRLGMHESCDYRDVVQHGIDHEMTFIGLIRGSDSGSLLSPSGATTVTNDDRLIYMAERKE